MPHQMGLYKGYCKEDGTVNGDAASVGAASYGFSPYTHAANEFGMIPTGEHPAQTVDISRSMDYESNVSKFAQTILHKLLEKNRGIPPSVV